MLLIQNLLNRQELDDSTGGFEERPAFVFGVLNVSDADR
jgi:hypothetical protein